MSCTRVVSIPYVYVSRFGFNGTFVLVIFVARKLNNISVNFFFRHRLRRYVHLLLLFFFLGFTIIRGGAYLYYYETRSLVSGWAIARTDAYAARARECRRDSRRSFVPPRKRYFVVNLSEKEAEWKKKTRKPRRKKVHNEDGRKVVGATWRYIRARYRLHLLRAYLRRPAGRPLAHHWRSGVGGGPARATSLARTAAFRPGLSFSPAGHVLGAVFSRLAMTI